VTVGEANMGGVTESILDKVLEKLVDVFGDKAVILLDESAKQRRHSFELYHALRGLEECLDITRVSLSMGV
jgi:hypothetical protein